MRQWRLIYDQPMAGVLNMAVDEAILKAGNPVPTLRLYRWSPPCLSIGYGQGAGDVDFERAAAHGWDVVRRPTGGKAILHIDDLTYSVILPESHPIAVGGIIESYRRISTALMAGLEALGAVTGAERKAEGAPDAAAVCFEVPSHYEVTCDGRKLIGSAQMRRRGWVLQHGSLPLVGDLARICDGLVYPDALGREQARAQVRARAITLSEALRRDQVSWAIAARAITLGFARAFDVDFGGGPVALSEAEMAMAHDLAVVYRSPEWTHRR